MKLDKKAQVSLEVLILVAGAIVVATAIGLYLKGISVQTTERLVQDTNEIVQDA